MFENIERREDEREWEGRGGEEREGEKKREEGRQGKEDAYFTFRISDTFRISTQYLMTGVKTPICLLLTSKVFEKPVSLDIISS